MLHKLKINSHNYKDIGLNMCYYIILRLKVHDTMYIYKVTQYNYNMNHYIFHKYYYNMKKYILILHNNAHNILINIISQTNIDYMGIKCNYFQNYLYNNSMKNDISYNIIHPNKYKKGKLYNILNYKIIYNLNLYYN